MRCSENVHIALYITIMRRSETVHFALCTKANCLFPLRAQVAPYKKVRKVEFTDAIPKSNTGKILRKELIIRIQQQLQALEVV